MRLWPAPAAGRILLGVCVAHFALWALANEPALRSAWWFLDDYAFAAGDLLAPRNVEHHLDQGRPGQLLWMFTFLLDGREDRTSANVLLRLGQGAIHALVGALVAGLLWRETGRVSTLLAALPFVLWPYNGETVLWRAAGQYTVAALFSLLAIVLLRAPGPPTVARGVSGSLLVVAAMLTLQTAACAGASVWCLAVGLAFLRPEPPPWKRLGEEALYLADGYIVGGAASVSVAWLMAPGASHRVALVSDLPAKGRLLMDANGLFLTSPIFYPRWLAGLQVLFLGLPVLVLLGARRDPARLRQCLFAVGCIAAGLVTPYLAHLPVAENDITWRMFYLAPLVFAGVWAFLGEGLGDLRAARLACYLVLLALLATYFPLARASSSLYPQLFAADRAMLRRIERTAAAAGVRAVCIPTDPDVAAGNPNPYGFDFSRWGVKLSAFLTEWSAPGFVRWFSPLEVAEGEPVASLCVALCRSETGAGGFRVRRLEAHRVLCVCPP